MKLILKWGTLHTVLVALFDGSCPYENQYAEIISQMFHIHQYLGVIIDNKIYWF
jgi:hypothetical protein